MIKTVEELSQVREHALQDLQRVPDRRERDAGNGGQNEEKQSLFHSKSNFIGNTCDKYTTKYDICQLRTS